MAVMRELVRRGEPVRMVNPRGQAAVHQGVEVLKGDGYSVESAREVTQGASVVYQCAQPPYYQWPQKFPALQTAILEAAATNGAKLVLAENLYMYGEVQGRIHEDLPYNARTRKGRVRAKMAEAALAAHRAGRVRVAIGRGSDFFGPGVLHSVLGARAIYPAFQGKMAQLFGKLDVPHTFTFIEDFGKALVILGENDGALGEVWHVPNDRPTITQHELMTMFFEKIGKPPKMKGMSKLVVMIGGVFVPAAREMVEMMYEFEKPFIVDSSKFENAFQMRATPIREAVCRTVEWFRSNPQ
jgi:nucleoside-diphosphate-sugar epimerase